MSIYTIEVLDKRHKNSELWKYRLKFNTSTSSRNLHFVAFHKFRVWCIEIYGASCERDMYEKTAVGFAYDALDGDYPMAFNPTWCWHLDQFNNGLYIYLRSEKELSFAQLKWNT